MTHDDDVPPAHVAVAGKHDHAITDHINRIAQVRVAATDSVPIFTEMAVHPKSARPVVSFCVRSADWKIKSVGHANKCCRTDKAGELRLRLRFSSQMLDWFSE